MIIRVIRELLCRHDYQVIGYDSKTFHAEFVCMKCNKYKDIFY